MTDPREFVELPAELRERIGVAIDSLIDLLDAIDAEPVDSEDEGDHAF